MLRPLKLVCVIAVIVGFSAGSAMAEEWVDLLPEGKLAPHWKTTGNWVEEDGAVTLKPRDGEKGWSRWTAYLWSDKEYDNFEISFEYMPEKKSNSGFYFNVGDKDDPVAKGVEVQIYESHSKGQDAKLTDHDSGGVIPGVAPTKNTANPAGEWSKFEITVQGNDLTVKLNGEVVNEVKLDEGRLKGRPEKGYIGFQDHALPLSLRNIKIRELE